MHECTIAHSTRISRWNLHMISTMSWFKQKRRIKERKRLLKKMVCAGCCFIFIVRWLSYPPQECEAILCMHEMFKQQNLWIFTDQWAYKYVKTARSMHQMHPWHVQRSQSASKCHSVLFPSSLPFIFFTLNVSLLNQEFLVHWLNFEIQSQICRPIDTATACFSYQCIRFGKFLVCPHRVSYWINQVDFQYF